MMDSKHLFPDTRQVVTKLNNRHADNRLREPKDAEVADAVVVMEQNFLHLVEPRAIRRWPVAVFIRDVVKRDRTGERLFRRVAMARCNDLVRINKGDRTRREAGNSRLSVLRDDHSDAAHDLRADVGWIRDLGGVVPVRRRRTEPERVVVRLHVSGINIEGVAIGVPVVECRGHGIMTFTSAKHVEVDAALGAPTLDVGDLNASRKDVDVNRPGPERRSIRCRESIDPIAELHLKLISRLEVQVGEVKHQQLRATGRRRRIECGGARPDRHGRG